MITWVGREQGSVEVEPYPSSDSNKAPDDIKNKERLWLTGSYKVKKRSYKVKKNDTKINKKERKSSERIAPN